VPAELARLARLPRPPPPLARAPPPLKPAPPLLKRAPPPLKRAPPPLLSKLRGPGVPPSDVDGVRRDASAVDTRRVCDSEEADSFGCGHALAASLKSSSTVARTSWRRQAQHARVRHQPPPLLQRRLVNGGKWAVGRRWPRTAAAQLCNRNRSASIEAFAGSMGGGAALAGPLRRRRMEVVCRHLGKAC
jgi:hypothetical protein